MTRVSPNARALIAGLCVVASFGLPAIAQADQYVVEHCTNFDTGAPATAFGTFAGQTANTCGTPGGALLRQQATVAANVTAGMSLTIPADRPNITIEALRTHYFSPGTAPPATTNGFAFMSLDTDSGQLANNDVSGGPADRVVPNPGDPPFGLPPGSRSVRWNIYCTNGGTCTFSNDFLLHVLSTRLYLNEHVAPTLTVTGGSLTGAGNKSGLATLILDAADTDSGVSGVTVALDQTQVAAAKFPCAADDWSACPRTEAGQILQANTALVPDGDHQLLVTARDAANNVFTRSLGTVTVANGAVSLPNGANPSRLAKVSARFTTTSKRSRTLRFSAGATVRGALLNEQGQPISGATVAILARPRQSGATDAQIATAPTGADGGFSAKLAAGPSRTITFAYTAFSTDARPATTATLKTNVRAIVSARVSPRSSRPGGRITLSGKLKLLPRKGVEIRIQARQGRSWRTIDDVRTAATGRFRWRYRFAGNQARRTYAFRARVASQNYPFAAASSKPALVRVR